MRVVAAFVFAPAVFALALGCTGSVSPTGPDGPNQPPDGTPGGTPPIEACAAPAIGAPLPLRRITGPQINAAIFDVMGIEGEVSITDETIIGYRSNTTTSVDRATAQTILLTTPEFAEMFVERNRAMCAPTCERWLFEEIAPRLFRRPLEAEERATYLGVYNAGTEQVDTFTGAKWAVEAFLSSPRFLYLLESTNDAGFLDGYSVGARLAVSLWGSVPDAELISAAESGALETEVGLREQAERMMDDPRFARGLSNFVEQWLELEELEDEAARPDFFALPAAEREALLNEPAAFLAAHIRDGATLEHALTSPRTVYDPELDAFYGSESVSVEGEFRQLDPAIRGGLVTLPAVQTALAHSDITSPSRRGQIVLAKVLCSPTPPPPPGVSPTLPALREGASLRERMEAHFSNPTCAGCHGKMDGVGFAFEGYDELGRFRTEDSSGNAINTESSFAIEGFDISVENAVELMEELGGRWDVSTCFATHYLRYATGMNENADSVCLIEEMGLATRRDGGLRAMILAFVTSDWFRRPRMGGE